MFFLPSEKYPANVKNYEKGMKANFCEHRLDFETSQ